VLALLSERLVAALAVDVWIHVVCAQSTDRGVQAEVCAFLGNPRPGCVCVSVGASSVTVRDGGELRLRTLRVLCGCRNVALRTVTYHRPSIPVLADSRMCVVLRNILVYMPTALQ